MLYHRNRDNSIFEIHYIEFEKIENKHKGKSNKKISANIRKNMSTNLKKYEGKSKKKDVGKSPKKGAQRWEEVAEINSAVDPR